MKKIYLDVAGRLHSLYRVLLERPPEGYSAVLGTGVLDRVSATAVKNGALFGAVTRGLSVLAPANLVKAQFDRFKTIPAGTDLTFANGHLVFRREPWVVDVEFVTQLAGYGHGHFRRYRPQIERRLAGESCKGVFSWTRAGTNGILENLNTKGFEDKIHHTPLAVPMPHEIVRDTAEDKPFTILFVGSINIAGQFAMKGGFEVFEAFRRLGDAYPNVRLIVRSDIDASIRSATLKDDRIIIKDGALSRSALQSLFTKADVLWFPGYHTPGLVILEAMSHELPVIATGVWATPEMVLHEKTGIVIPPSETIPFDGVNVPGWGSRAFMRGIRAADPLVVADLVDATARLIDDPAGRRRMGLAGRREVETGTYSIANRNAILKRIFDDALGDA